MKKRGFALAELLVALVISGVIGVALARLVINQSRFVATQDAVMRARSGARSALNVMLQELRMVSDSGIRAAHRDSITVRVPFAFGIACAYSSGRTIVSLLPADSATMVNATVRGMAYQTGGQWRFVEPSVFTSGAPNGNCWGQTPSVSVLAAPTWTARSYYGSGVAPPVGSPVYFYQTVTYVFAASTDLPGRRALWRAVQPANVREELVAPFDTSAHFEFLVGNAMALQTAVPAQLDSIMGVRIRLIAESENTPAGRSVPIKFDLTTKVLFRNHAP
jgi:prepilin-type N-terminal cleavage/methylation domain-containing protein